MRELLRAYSEKYSDVTVEFVEGVPPAELVARMQDRKLDVAFVRNQPALRTATSSLYGKNACSWHYQPVTGWKIERPLVGLLCETSTSS